MSRASLAIGTAQLGLDYGVANQAGRPSDAEAVRILELAFEHRVTYVDTAPAYGDAETLVGRALRGAGPGRIRVATKTPRFPSGLSSDGLARALNAAVDRSRTRLGMEALDDLLIHSVDNLREYRGLLVDLLVDHQRRGHVGRLGVSIYEEIDVEEVISQPALMVTQFPFSVLNRTLVEKGAIESLSAPPRQTFARGPLHQGLLLLDPQAGDAAVPGAGPSLRRFREACQRAGIDPLAAALAYAAAESRAAFVVVGVESARQLRPVIDLFGAELPAGFAADVTASLVDVPATVRDPRRWPARTA